MDEPQSEPVQVEYEGEKITLVLIPPVSGLGLPNAIVHDKPKKIKEILRRIEGGVTRVAAARASGVDPSCLNRWAMQDRSLVDKILQAEGKARARVEALRFKDAAQDKRMSPEKGFKARDEWLRTHPTSRADWGSQIEVKNLSDEQLREAIRVLELRHAQRLQQHQASIVIEVEPPEQGTEEEDDE